MMKKLLIFTVSTGGGHNQAASSLEQEFTQHDYQVVKLDALKETNKILDALITDGYKILANNFPNTFGELYKLSNKKKVNYSITNLITSIIQDKIYQLVITNQPDLIIATHPFIVDVIGGLKEKEELIIPFISVVTDFQVHQTYIHDHVDAYITGSYHTKLSIINRGVPQEKIYTYGIPIRKEFFIHPLREKKSEDDFTILLMGGSMGVKSMDKVLNNLIKSPHPLKIFAICGNNQILKNKIESKYKNKFVGKDIDIYGFTKNIPQLMDAADIIITKPGGLTVSESIAKNLPIIIPYLIPGQEEENAKFLVKSNLAIKTDKIKNITQVVDQLIEDPEHLQQMREKMSELSKIHSTENIVKLADKLILSNYREKNHQNNQTEILILSAGFGLGHHSVSYSIKEHLQAENPQLRVNIVDLFELLTPQLADQIYKGHEVLVKKSHEIYNYFYHKKTSKSNSQINKLLYKLYLSKISKYIQQTKPKIIISTFPTSSGFVSLYKKEYNSTIPLITCITNLVDNWEWIFPETDRYLVATAKQKEELINKGISKDNIKITGIPVKKDFLHNSCNISIGKELNIPDDDLVILMMGGGIGLLPEDQELYDWLDSLAEVTTIILTEKNKKAYDYLTKKKFTKIRVLKFTHRVPEIMSLSGIIVTKAGGVSIFEAINSELPIIAYHPILGQEIENGRFIVDSNIGVVVEDIAQLKTKISDFTGDCQLRSELQKNIRTLRQTLSLNNLAQYILEIFPQRKLF